MMKKRWNKRKIKITWDKKLTTTYTFVSLFIFLFKVTPRVAHARERRRVAIYEGVMTRWLGLEWKLNRFQEKRRASCNLERQRLFCTSFYSSQGLDQTFLQFHGARILRNRLNLSSAKYSGPLILIYKGKKGRCKESTIRGHRKNLSPRWDSNPRPSVF